MTSSSIYCKKNIDGGCFPHGYFLSSLLLMIPLLILIIESVTFAVQDRVFPLRLPVTSGGDIHHRLVSSAQPTY